MNDVTYDWAGSTILFDTFHDRCRWIFKDTTDDTADNDIRLFVPTDVRDMMAHEDNWEMKAIVRELRKSYNLPVEREQGSFDARALACWKWMADHVAFVRDERSQDFWQRPAETYTRGKGDCEDNAILLASMLIASGISAYNVRITLGTVVDGDNGKLRHVWVMYKAEDGAWRIMDVLTGRASIPTAFATPANAGTPYGEYEPSFCFNRDHVWGIGALTSWNAAMPTISNSNEFAHARGSVIQPVKVNTVLDQAPEKIEVIPAETTTVPTNGIATAAKIMTTSTKIRSISAEITVKS